MPNIPSIKIGDTTYDVKDQVARDHLVEVGTAEPTPQSMHPDNRLYVKDYGSVVDEEAHTYEVPTMDEFTELKRAVSESVNNGKIYLKCGFALGNLSSDGELKPSEKYRVSSTEIISYDRPITILMADNFYLIIDLFDAQDQYSDQILLYSVRSTVLPANQKFKVCIRRKTEDTSEIADINTFAKQVTIKSIYTDRIDGIEGSVQTLQGNYTLVDGYTMFANKTIGNGGFIIDETGTMAWMPRILYPAGTVIKLTDYTHQRYYVKYWTGSIASANVHDSGWMTADYTLPSDSYVGVGIKNKVNDTSPFTFADAYRMLMVIPPNQWQKGLSERIEINKNSIANNLNSINSVDEAVTHKMSYVKGVNHRGFNTEAPENTLPAFVLSRKKGFLYVETDIRYTSDGVAVLLHDETINRTARNADGTELSETINIADITLAQAREYVFCKDMYSTYPTVQIPTFEEFITLCRNIGLHPYVELKGSPYNASVLVDIVKGCGMLRNVTWISFGAEYLAQVKTADPKARLGLLATDVTLTIITYAQNLKTNDNEVFIDAANNSDNVALCKEAGIPLEVYTLNDKGSIINANAYISGVTSDTLAANNVLYEYGIVN